MHNSQSLPLLSSYRSRPFTGTVRGDNARGLSVGINEDSADNNEYQHQTNTNMNVDEDGHADDGDESYYTTSSAAPVNVNINSGDDDDVEDQTQSSAGTTTTTAASVGIPGASSYIKNLLQAKVGGEASSSSDESVSQYRRSFHNNHLHPHTHHQHHREISSLSGISSEVSCSAKSRGYASVGNLSATTTKPVPSVARSICSRSSRSVRSTSSTTLSSIGTFSKMKQGGKPYPYTPNTFPKVTNRRSNRHSQYYGYGSNNILSSLTLVVKIFGGVWFLSFMLLNQYSYRYRTGSTTIPIPPPPQQKVSVVIMNYSRPRMIQQSSLLPTLLEHSSVDEVILLHANPKTTFKFVHPKVVNIDASTENDRMGLSVRFYFCQLAKNDWVIHVDEDMEFSENSLNEMLVEFAKNTQRIVGRFGRDRQEGNSFQGYSSKDTHKETEVILTKLMVMERDTCSAFFEYSHLIWEDIVLNHGEGPLWNGEDIFMSLVANHVYGADVGAGEKINYAMDWLDVTDAPEELKDYSNGRQDISGGFSKKFSVKQLWDFNWYRSLLIRNRHYSYRGSLWKMAKDRLATSGPYLPQEP